MDLEAFEIESTVVHYVPTVKDEPDPQLLLTNAAIELDDDLTDYFAAKIKGRLASRSLEVVHDPDRNPTVPEALTGILGEPDELVERSQTIAERLFEVQSGANSSGLLAIVIGRVGRQRAVAVLKLERQRGVSFDIDAASGTVDLELLRNLTLTDKTKVYKTAIFVGDGHGGLVGLVADYQRTSASGAVVASFFLSFLGCKPKEPAAETTHRFVRVANEGINADVESPERRGRYQVALLSTMQDNTTDITPKKFIDQHFEPDDRKPLLDRFAAAGFDVKKSFTKDTTRVKVDAFKMTFESGMVLVGPPSALEDNVEIPDQPSASDPVQLKDTVRSLLAGR
jgi:hypothetical protein